MGEVINDFIHISLMKYALQSLKGQKKKKKKKKEEEEALRKLSFF